MKLIFLLTKFSSFIEINWTGLSNLIACMCYGLVYASPIMINHLTVFLIEDFLSFSILDL